MPCPKTWGPTIGIRFKLVDDAALREAAKARGIPASVLVREIILAAFEGSAYKRMESEKRWR